MSTEFLNSSDSIIIDGSKFPIKRSVFVDFQRDRIHFTSTADGQVINITFRRRELTKVKYLIYKLLNKLNIYSCESNRIAIKQLQYCGVI